MSGVASLIAISWTVLAACGPAAADHSPSAPGALAGKSAHDIVLAAATDNRQSFRFGVSGSLSADTGGLKNVTPAMLKGFGPLAEGIVFTGKGEQESATRRTTTVTLSGSPSPIVEVSYDGTSYVSDDGGRHFATGSLAPETAGIDAGPEAVKRLLKDLPSAKDLGPATRNGVDAEHLQAPVDATLIERLLGNSASSSSPSQAARIGKLITAKGGAIDIGVRRDTGALDSATVKASFAFDVGAAAQALAGGTLPAATAPAGSVFFSLDAATLFSDYGSPITVVRPSVGAAAPDPSAGVAPVPG